MTPGGIRVVRARSPRAMRAFIDLPYRLHANRPHWVPPLRRDIRTLLDRDKHPFHQHATVEYFLAVRDGRVVGRISAHENYQHNLHHGEKVGFFGFIEAENDREVFDALLRAAAKWCRARGLEAMRGPCSFSTNEECGLLVRGFDGPPTIMCPYQPEYYQQHIEALGFTKAEDLLGFRLHEDIFSHRIPRLASAMRRRQERRGENVRIRHLDMARFDQELELVKTVYNKAWSSNWGFVPLTDAELDFMAREMKPLVVPELALFAEVDGQPAGFCLALPDYNVALHRMGGRLTPRSLLVFALLRPHIHRIRLLMFGVVAEYRQRGLDLLLYDQIATNCIERGITEAELSWLLERNRAIVQPIEAMGSRHYRTFRIYEQSL